MKKDISWIYLAHLGYNMWYEPLEDKMGIHCPEAGSDLCRYVHATHKLRFEDDYWQELTAQLREAGCDTILLDIGEGLRFETHPELAIEGSWSKQKLADELDRLRAMGFEVLPKLNFSACHDEWLGEYGRMVSTSVYYKAVQELIEETAELFGNPRLFHLGFDEETAHHQQHNNYMVIRQGEQWWYDLNKIVGFTEAAGSRAWIWSDYGWGHWEEFKANMSKEIVQSNWYYNDFKREEPHLTYMALYDKLEEAGFDQIPTGSGWALAENFPLTVEYCGERIAPERLLGYMQSVWNPTMREARQRHDISVAAMKQAIGVYRK